MILQIITDAPLKPFFAGQKAAKRKAGSLKPSINAGVTGISIEKAEIQAQIARCIAAFPLVREANASQAGLTREQLQTCWQTVIRKANNPALWPHRPEKGLFLDRGCFQKPWYLHHALERSDRWPTIKLFQDAKSQPVLVRLTSATPQLNTPLAALLLHQVHVQGQFFVACGYDRILAPLTQALANLYLVLKLNYPTNDSRVETLHQTILHILRYNGVTTVKKLD